MDCLPKKSEVLLDEEIEKQEFVKIKIQFTKRNVISMPYSIQLLCDCTCSKKRILQMVKT
ncbi:hypothetical protein CW306_21055 [Bacillus sp. BA3]|nr:hypothetical protein CW306_21055 [Bacillus sp. BA3]